MPINATQRAYLSDVLAGVSSFEGDTKTNYNFASVEVGGTGSIPCIGVPVVWNDDDEQFEVYVDQDIDNAGSSSLPNGSPIAIVVGDNYGVGFNKKDVDLSETPTMTVLYRGSAAILKEGMVWGQATTNAQAAFLAQLETQGITVQETAKTAETSYAGV